MTCPDKYYCLDELPPIPCPPGYISPTGSLTCTACTDGTYESANVCVNCPAGHYCPTPVSPPYPCPFGTYSAGSTVACSPCTAGSMCAMGSSSATQYACPPGFKCETIQVDPDDAAILATWPLPCTPGEYSLAGTCTPCTAGYYCPLGTQDPEQYPCPPGHYCPLGSAIPLTCDAGTYNRLWKKSDKATECLDCPAGSYCVEGATNPYICPPGHYCGASASGPSSCDAGEFFPGVRAESDAECVDCPAGYYCEEGSIWPTPCLSLIHI